MELVELENMSSVGFLNRQRRDWGEAVVSKAAQAWESESESLASTVKTEHDVMQAHNPSAMDYVYGRG